MSWRTSCKHHTFKCLIRHPDDRLHRYARTLFAMNPDTISADGKVDMSAGGNPIKFPEDIAATLRSGNNAAQSYASSSSYSDDFDDLDVERDFARDGRGAGGSTLILEFDLDDPNRRGRVVSVSLALSLPLSLSASLSV